MYKILTTVILLLISSIMYSQINFEDHIKSIRAEDEKGNFNANERAVNYALKYLKDNGIEEKYITNKNLLTEIESLVCEDSVKIYFKKKLLNETTIEVNIKFKEFNIDEHHIEEIDDINYIDGEIAVGAYYGTPNLEIECIRIKVNGKNITIPKSAYSKFYEVYQCKKLNPRHYFYMPIKVYSSNDGKYLFIYIRGGNASETYYSKLIFNQETYITQIIADYRMLLEWKVFNNPDFIGF